MSEVLVRLDGSKGSVVMPNGEFSGVNGVIVATGSELSENVLVLAPGAGVALRCKSPDILTGDGVEYAVVEEADVVAILV